MADDDFPKTLYVTAGSDEGDGSGRDYFGKEDVEQMNNGDGASHGTQIAVYELREVVRVEVTRTLVAEKEG